VRKKPAWFEPKTGGNLVLSEMSNILGNRLPQKLNAFGAQHIHCFSSWRKEKGEVVFKIRSRGSTLLERLQP